MNCWHYVHCKRDSIWFHSCLRSSRPRSDNALAIEYIVVPPFVCRRRLSSVHFPFSKSENRIHFPFPCGIVLRITQSHAVRHTHYTQHSTHTFFAEFIAANFPSTRFPHFLPIFRSEMRRTPCTVRLVCDQYTQTPYSGKNNYPGCYGLRPFSPFSGQKSNRRKNQPCSSMANCSIVRLVNRKEVRGGTETSFSRLNSQEFVGNDVAMAKFSIRASIHCFRAGIDITSFQGIITLCLIKSHFRAHTRHTLGIHTHETIVKRVRYARRLVQSEK